MPDIEPDKYRLLVQAVTDYAIYLLSPEGHIASWNPGAARFEGYTAEEVLGAHFSCLHTPEDRREDLAGRALRVARESGRFEDACWHVRKDGRRFRAHVVIDPVRGPDGGILGFAMITRDQTERLAADEKLRHSEEQFRLLVQGVTDYAIYKLDAEGHVASWNAGAERIKGYREEEVLGRHFSLFYTPEDVARGRPAHSLETARTKGVFESEGWRVRKDGTRFWAQVLVDRLDDAQGRPVGFAKITRDVTERKQAEEALAAAREALFQAQKAESIGKLTGGVAHDFNNLLMAVMSNLELLRKWLPDDPRPHRLLDNAVAGAERGAALTQRMLAFARRQELHMRPTDVPSLVGGMADLLQRSLGPQITVNTLFSLKLPLVMVDPNQLELALLNLAVNGRDAMPGGGDLQIGARRERVGAGHPSQLPDGDYLCLWVTDEGHGMDEQTLARATEPFFTTKGVGKGTGLGLSMAQGLAEQSGGRLQIESDPERGTTVQMWLPVATAQVLRPSPPATEAAIEASTDTPALRVLVVDDDDLILCSTVALLEDMGHAVHGVRSGDEALAALRGGDAFDLLLTDHAMPGLCGAGLIQAVLDEKPGMPTILASGFAENLDADCRAIRLGKPYGKPELVRSIEAALLAAASPDHEGQSQAV